MQKAKQKFEMWGTDGLGRGLLRLSWQPAAKMKLRNYPVRASGLWSWLVGCTGKRITFPRREVGGGILEYSREIYCNNRRSNVLKSCWIYILQKRGAKCRGIKRILRCRPIVFGLSVLASSTLFFFFFPPSVYYIFFLFARPIVLVIDRILTARVDSFEVRRFPWMFSGRW